MEETPCGEVTYPRWCKEFSWWGIKPLSLGSCALTLGILSWTDWMLLTEAGLVPKILTFMFWDL